jgi:hypothetical protein
VLKLVPFGSALFLSFDTPEYLDDSVAVFVAQFSHNFHPFISEFAHKNA